MSGVTLRIIITAVLVFHGVGQLMGILPVFHFLGSDTANAPKWGKNWSSHSWLLTKKLGEPASRLICFLLYFSAFVLFIVVILALQGWLIPYALWRTLAIVAALVSLTALFLFWNALIFTFPHKVGDIAVNVAVLAGLLVFNWPSESVLGF